MTITTETFSLAHRITTVVQSCKTQAQTRVAVKYAQLLMRRQPVELQNWLKLVLFRALTDFQLVPKLKSSALILTVGNGPTTKSCKKGV